jgi:uncharacterized protein (TIGR03435 family)
MPRLAAAAALFCLPLVAGAQSAAAPAFEVASVKPVPAGTEYGGMKGGPGSSSPGQITYSAATLRAVLCKAYGVERYQFVAPPWLDQERFDIVAKIPPDTDKDQFSLMLRNLLAERFKLALHSETQPYPVYALVVSKSGLKLKPSGDGPRPGPAPEKFSTPETLVLGNDIFPVMAADATGIMGVTAFGTGKTYIRGQKATLKDIVGMLKDAVDRPIVDQTGLSDKYDFTVSWTPEKKAPGVDPLVAADTDATVFTAMEKFFGLKLEPKKLPIEVLVIDHVEKVPSEN